MAKKKSVSRMNTSRKSTRLSISNIIMISSMLTLIIGVIFAIIQYVGETTGVLPILNLGELDWGMDGDVIIIFVIGFMISIFIGSTFVLYFIRKKLSLKI